MYFLIFLCLVSFQVHAADNEKSGGKKGAFNFVYNEQSSNDGHKEIEAFMKFFGLEKQISVFCNIAKNEKLSDAEKVEKKRIFTPITYFKDLGKKNEDEKNKILITLLQQVKDENYSLGRLLLASCMYAGIDVNKRTGFENIFSKALLRDDISLVKLALKKAKVNDEFSGYVGSVYRSCPYFHLCQSAEAIRLMIKEGANTDQMEKLLRTKIKEFIYSPDFMGEKEEGVLREIAEYITPNEKKALCGRLKEEVGRQENLYDSFYIFKFLRTENCEVVKITNNENLNKCLEFLGAAKEGNCVKSECMNIKPANRKH